MATSQKRRDRIATAYSALVRGGLPATSATYLLAVEGIDRKGGEDG